MELIAAKPRAQKDMPAPIANNQPAPTAQSVMPRSIEAMNSASVFCVPSVVTMPLATTLPTRPTTP
jgi:hypothetical protein